MAFSIPLKPISLSERTVYLNKGLMLPWEFRDAIGDMDARLDDDLGYAMEERLLLLLAMVSSENTWLPTVRC